MLFMGDIFSQPRSFHGKYLRISHKNEIYFSTRKFYQNTIDLSSNLEQMNKYCVKTKKPVVFLTGFV